MNQTNTLELVWKTREGGKGRTKRDYLDFVIDGIPLGDFFSKWDYIGCLGSDFISYDLEMVEKLLTNLPSDLNDDRYSIYVCPECGDIGCGAITAQIIKSNEGFIWQKFGLQNNYEDEIRYQDEFKKIGPFLFKESEYVKVLTNRPAIP